MELDNTKKNPSDCIVIKTQNPKTFSTNTYMVCGMNEKQKGQMVKAFGQASYLAELKATEKNVKLLQNSLDKVGVTVHEQLVYNKKASSAKTFSTQLQFEREYAFSVTTQVELLYYTKIGFDNETQQMMIYQSPKIPAELAKNFSNPNCCLKVVVSTV